MALPNGEWGQGQPGDARDARDASSPQHEGFGMRDRGGAPRLARRVSRTQAPVDAGVVDATMTSVGRCARRSRADAARLRRDARAAAVPLPAGHARRAPTDRAIRMISWSAGKVDGAAEGWGRRVNPRLGACGHEEAPSGGPHRLRGLGAGRCGVVAALIGQQIVA